MPSCLLVIVSSWMGERILAIRPPNSNSNCHAEIRSNLTSSASEMMMHLPIAKIFDAGTTERDQPYFVIIGTPLLAGGHYLYPMRASAPSWSLASTHSIGRTILGSGSLSSVWPLGVDSWINQNSSSQPCSPKSPARWSICNSMILAAQKGATGTSMDH